MVDERSLEIFKLYLSRMQSVSQPPADQTSEIAFIAGLRGPMSNQDLFNDAVAQAFRADVLRYGRLKKVDPNLTEFRKMWNEKWGEEFSVDLKPSLEPSEDKPVSATPPIETPAIAPEVIPPISITPIIEKDQPQVETEQPPALPQETSNSSELSTPHKSQEGFKSRLITIGMYAAIGAALGSILGLLAGPIGIGIGIALGAIVGASIAGGMIVLNERRPKKPEPLVKRENINLEPKEAGKAPGPHATPLISPVTAVVDVKPVRERSPSFNKPPTAEKPRRPS